MKEVRRKLSQIELTSEENATLFCTLNKLDEMNCKDISIENLSSYLYSDYFDKTDIIILFRFLEFIPYSITNIEQLLTVYKIMTIVNN